MGIFIMLSVISFVVMVYYISISDISVTERPSQMIAMSSELPEPNYPPLPKDDCLTIKMNNSDFDSKIDFCVN